MHNTEFLGKTLLAADVAFTIHEHESVRHPKPTVLPWALRGSGVGRASLSDAGTLGHARIAHSPYQPSPEPSGEGKARGSGVGRTHAPPLPAGGRL